VTERCDPFTAHLLGIGRNQAYDAVRRGDIPAIKIGGRWLVLRVPFQRMLDGVDT
jgi:excisionase family DNA binding protein